MSFANMKKSAKSDLNSLRNKLQSNKRESFENVNEWKLTRGKDGNGSAIIRFLPAGPHDDAPWVQEFSHGFQGPNGRWYIEKCPTSWGEKCPVCEENNKSWNKGTDTGKQEARDRKRRLKYVSNIYIIRDPQNPENEGTVKMFSYGKKIFEKIQNLMNPDFEDDTPVNPFDLWSGADFRIKIKTVDGYPNYDASSFDSPSTLGDFDDEKLEEIWNSQHNLGELVSPSKNKSYEELADKVNIVLYGEASPTRPKYDSDDDVVVVATPSAKPNFAAKKAAAPVVEEEDLPFTPDTKETVSSSDDEDESLDFFRKLAAE